jgi:hypothetical protein
VSDALHPAAPHHLPGFITAPGETDILMIAVGILLLAAVLGVGNLYLHLHTLPERLAHKSKKLQFEIVAVLCLLALFTHNHLFWVIGLMLALIDLPDFLTPLRNIAASVGRLAGDRPAETADAMPGGTAAVAPAMVVAPVVAPAVVVAPAPATAKTDLGNARTEAADGKTDTANSKAEPPSREVPRHA